MKKKAFSLIELSIVLLIIGIIITGITQSSRLISAFRLSNARTVTNSSPVSSIEGLALWLETTREESFNSSIQEGSEISSWKNINPQSVELITAVQNIDSRKPLYKENGINGLPAIYCDGDADSDANTNTDNLEIAAGNSYRPTSEAPFYNDFTMFLVASPEEDHQIDVEGDVTSGTVGQKYVLFPPQGTIRYGNGNAGVGISLGTNGVSVYEHSSAYMSPVVVYGGAISSKGAVITVNYKNKLASLTVDGSINQAGVAGSVYVTRAFPPTTFCYKENATSGPEGSDFKGHIGEFIVFSRSLKLEERQVVEQYLIKKWGI